MTHTNLRRPFKIDAFDGRSQSGGLAWCPGQGVFTLFLVFSGPDVIGHASELIGRGVPDTCLCGASEESTLRQVWGCLDNWGGMPSSWNDHPEKACRPYDQAREGPVLPEGAGILVLEAWNHALQRGGRPLCRSRWLRIQQWRSEKQAMGSCRATTRGRVLLRKSEQQSRRTLSERFSRSSRITVIAANVGASRVPSPRVLPCGITVYSTNTSVRRKG
jgi:hypothetical protein